MSETYHKIQTLFTRDLDAPGAPVIEGTFSCPELAYLKHCIWEFTEKIDGVNIRIVFRPDGRVFKGRKENSAIPANLYMVLEKLFPADCEKFYDWYVGTEGKPIDVCFYGEGFGGSVPTKRSILYNPDDVGFILFDVWIDGWWLQRTAVEEIAAFFNIPIVPVIGKGTLFEMVDIVEDGLESAWGGFEVEGIVARPTANLLTRGKERIITKLKGEDFPK